MRRQVGYEWKLRELMALRGLFTTTQLGPLLAERGIELSASQVHRWSPASRSGSRCKSSPRCATSLRWRPVS